MEESIKEYHNAIITPEVNGIFASGGVIYNGDYLQDTLLSPAVYRKNKETIDSLNNEAILYDDSEVLFLGCFYNCWGHSITDSLRFLWVFLPFYRKKLDQRLYSLKMVYITAGGINGSIIGKNFRDILNTLGINVSDIVEVKESTKYKKVYVPEACFAEDEKTIEKHFTKKYQEVINFIISKIDCSSQDSSTKTIYLSRTHWQHGLRRKDFGERTIEKAILKYYPECEIVYPENLTFFEQVELLSKCNKLITTEGSIGHNAVFLPLGSEIVLLQKCWLRNRYQKAINESRQLKVTYLKAYWNNHLLNEKYNPMIGPFFLCVTDEIAKYLGCNFKISIGERFTYDMLFFYRVVKALFCKSFKFHSSNSVF